MSQLIMGEGATPPTPSSGKASIFIDLSGNLCKIDDAGNVMKIASAGSFTLTIPATGTVAILEIQNIFTGQLRPDGLFVYGRSDLTIASGAITVTKPYHRIDTEASAATDDLDTINGIGAVGQLLVLQAVNSLRTVVLKDGTGNLRLAGDFSMDNVEDKIMLIAGISSEWHEMSRSDNGA